MCLCVSVFVCVSLTALTLPGLRVFPGYPAYVATKWAVVGFTKSMAVRIVSSYELGVLVKSATCADCGLNTTEPIPSSACCIHVQLKIRWIPLAQVQGLSPLQSSRGQNHLTFAWTRENRLKFGTCCSWPFDSYPIAFCLSPRVMQSLSV